MPRRGQGSFGFSHSLPRAYHWRRWAEKKMANRSRWGRSNPWEGLVAIAPAADGAVDCPTAVSLEVWRQSEMVLTERRARERAGLLDKFRIRFQLAA